MVGPMDPVTVVYVGNFRRPWCTEVHTTGSLEALGHRVVRFQENELDWSTLPGKVKQTGAACVIWTRTWDVDGDKCTKALEDCRAMGVPSAFYHLDRWWGLEREYQLATMPWFQATDVTFSPHGDPALDWDSVGISHVWLPPGVYGKECGVVRANPRRWPHEVVFVGSYPYPHKDWADYRAELIETFREHFGSRFGLYPPQGLPVRGRQLQELYATAKVVIGDSCLAGGASHYWSDRIPETLGRGGLLIHPHVEGLDDWYPNIGTVGVHTDLVAKANLLTYPLGEFSKAVELAEWALANPVEAKEIAAHGRETVLVRDTYRHRMATVLQHLADHHGMAPRSPATRTRRDFAGPTIPAGSVDGAPVEQVRATRAGARADFLVRVGHPTDREVIQEVWQADQYRLKPEHIRGGVVVDVGANIGAFTVLACKLGARVVHAYEPEPDNYRLLEANLKAQPPARLRGWMAFPLAVGAESGEVHLAPGPGGAHGGGTHVAGPGEPDMVVAPMASIDSVLTQAIGDGDGTVHLLKLDCEGGEYRIIEGMDPELLANVRRISMEFHGPGMPHLTHLEQLGDIGDDHYKHDHTDQSWWATTVWGRLVAKLAEHGRLSIAGRPWMGGLIHWERF